MVLADCPTQVWFWVFPQDHHSTDPRSGAVQRFDTLDGLASNEFNQGAVATTRAGEVLIGGVRGDLVSDVLQVLNPFRGDDPADVFAYHGTAVAGIIGARWNPSHLYSL